MFLARDPRAPARARRPVVRAEAPGPPGRRPPRPPPAPPPRGGGSRAPRRHRRRRTGGGCRSTRRRWSDRRRTGLPPRRCAPTRPGRGKRTPWASKPRVKWSRSPVTRYTPRVCTRVNSARVAGRSSGARPSSSLIAAAYIRARPRALPTPPEEAGPSARTARVLANSTRSVGGSAWRLKAIGVRPRGSGLPARGPSASGAGRTLTYRGSSDSGRPRWKSSWYGDLTRSSYTSWRELPVARPGGSCRWRGVPPRRRGRR